MRSSRARKNRQRRVLARLPGFQRPLVNAPAAGGLLLRESQFSPRGFQRAASGVVVSILTLYTPARPAFA